MLEGVSGINKGHHYFIYVALKLDIETPFPSKVLKGVPCKFDRWNSVHNNPTACLAKDRC